MNKPLFFVLPMRAGDLVMKLLQLLLHLFLDLQYNLAFSDSHAVAGNNIHAVHPRANNFVPVMGESIYRNLSVICQK